MRNIRVLAPLLMALAVLSPIISSRAQAQGSESVQQQVSHLRDQWLEAERTGNRALLERLLAGNCEVMTPQGSILNKAQMLQRTENHNVKFDTLRASDTHVRVYGDVAILTDHTTVSAQENGKHIGGQFRFIRIFVKQNGNWQAAMAQGTRLPTKPESLK